MSQLRALHSHLVGVGLAAGTKVLWLLVTSCLSVSGTAHASVCRVPEDLPSLAGPPLHIAGSDTVSFKPPTIDDPAFTQLTGFLGESIVLRNRQLPRELRIANDLRRAGDIGCSPNSGDRVFVRGDADADFDLSMSDAVFILSYRYVPGSPEPPCMDAADVDDNGGIIMSDAICLLRYLYVPGGFPPASPFPHCGVDTSADSLDCEAFPPCEGWSEQEQVNRADSLYDVGGRAGVDSEGDPWVVWMGEPGPGLPFKVFVAHRTGVAWEEEQVTPTDSLDPRGDRVPDIAIDDEDVPWVVWHRYDEGGDSHVFWSVRDEFGWSDAERVDTSQSRGNWAPFIDFGGGELWATWYGGGPDDPYDVYCSHWNGVDWDGEIQVNQSDSGFHWFADIAVDGDGIPHVAWSEYWSGCVYYSAFDGESWSEQVVVNDTSVEHGYLPSIAVDDGGNIHIAWVGYFLDPIVDVDIFYRRSDGLNWSEEIMVNEPDTLTDYAPRIVAVTDTILWVVWEDVDSQDDSHVHCRVFDGDRWLPEEQIDGDDTHEDFGQRAIVDDVEILWVFWSGQSSTGYEIYGRRHHASWLE